MAWNPSDYSNVNQLTLSSNEVWKPNLLLQFTKSDDQKILNEQHPILVNQLGVISWWTSKILSTRCSIDLTEFPYDDQKCQIIIVSFAPKQQVNYTVLNRFGDELWLDKPKDISPQWILKDKHSDIQITKIMANDYPILRLQVTFQRNNTFYFYIISMPYFVSTILSIIQFGVSPNCKMRYFIGSIALSIDLILLVYLSMIFNYKTFRVPKLIIRLSDDVLANVLVLCSSIFMKNFLIKFSHCESYIILNSFLHGNPFGKLICCGYLYSNDSSAKNAIKDQLINILIDRITFIIFLTFTLITYL